MAEFPFKPQFKHAVFQGDVERAWRSEKPDDLLDYYLRDKGLRYVIEAPGDMTQDEVARMVKERLHREFSVERLFEDFEGNPAPENLRSVYLATLRGVLPQDLTQSPHEGAYALLAQSRLLSVELDQAYTRFPPDAATSVAPASPAPSLDDKAWSIRNLRANEAWALFAAKGRQDGGGISVAHLDTGWTEHDDLDRANFDLSRAMDYVYRGGDAKDDLWPVGNPGHGTRTASVILSRGDVAPGWPPGTLPPGEVTGVARYATYVPIRCIRSVIVIFGGDVARALRHATAHDCHVASLSLGGRPLKALRLALEDAVANDLLVVCASGNHVRIIVVWPAQYADAIALAASNIDDKPWRATSRGRRIDVSAPGENVWKADPDPHGKANSKGSGTSYATANTAGAAALWLSYHGRALLQAEARRQGLNLQELFRGLLAITARKPPGWNHRKFGTGIVDAKALLLASPASARKLAPHPGSRTELASLVCEDDPQQGMAVLATLLRVRLPGLGAFLQVFEHELKNVLLDHPECLKALRAMCAPGSGRDLGPVVAALRDKVSETLRSAAGW